jgi:cephalosporin hydroxylase
MNKLTFVTALLDIKRSDLESKSFHRSFDRYIETLTHLLRHLQYHNLVIYIDPQYEELVKSIKSEHIIINYVTCEDLRKTKYYHTIQDIRNNNEWRNQVGWLSESTQANLELYNPLIFQKLHWLNDVAIQNPFNTEYFLWIDAGIANAQCHPGYFSKPWFEKTIVKYLNKFLFLCFPYEGHGEIHGFKREAMHKYCNDQIVDRVARATFFGGKKAEINFLTQKFEDIATLSLSDGYMGTEESIFTILTYLYPELINIEMIGGNGLVSSFFEKIQDEANNTFNGSGSFHYLGARIQQHPSVFNVFKNFLSEHRDIKTIIEIGTGGGGLAMFLKEQCDHYGMSFFTYERHCDALVSNKNFVTRNIKLTNGDVFDATISKQIVNQIQSDGKTLILCDGGNKIKEFNFFAQFMKPGDIIMAHDYAPNKNIFETKYKNQIWNWHEIQDSDINDACKNYFLEKYYSEFEDIAWVCRQKIYQPKTDLYIVTFNSPAQFDFVVSSIIEASPNLFKNSDKYVINNSNDPSFASQYQLLFQKYAFTEFAHDNIGICGARQFIADHFATTPNKYMLFFEDDMGMNGPDKEHDVCINGFKKYHPFLYENIIGIMEKENYDFLKLSFTEFFGDNTIQWSWYNVPQEFRSKHWPNKQKLPEEGLDPEAPKTLFKNIKTYNKMPYADGEIYYCNWPQIVSKNGNKKMFLDTKWKYPYEQTWMSFIYQKTIQQKINPAILLLSPTDHNRFDHYKSGLRKEN